MTNPKSGPYQSFYQETAETVARTLGIELVPSLIEGPADIERAIKGYARHEVIRLLDAKRRLAP